eukprot:CAMPEP_0182426858 /NCGR_PEP_ID=MMETSP1167-20130531/13376_1 /TAXON_ID=2988 /ORGANISM="Mallomonas Sp, Strain CCMP3275" /LENGTH=171 /DNA_ID=CAMNT_0024608585 /DNA_START=57 /DNA_END=572 /DNA_ORIENTATION=+
MLLKEALQELRIKKKLDDEDMRIIASDELVQKYCFLAEQDMLKSYRTDAMRHRLRRPWDGEDGEKFISWIDTEGKGMVLGPLSGENAEEAKALHDHMQKGDYGSQYESESITSVYKDETKAHDIEDFAFSWEGCDNMEDFTSPMWELYRQSHESAMEKAARIMISLGNAMS